MSNKKRKTKVLTHNLKVGRRPNIVKWRCRAVLVVRRPRFVNYQEAKAYRAELKKIRGYEMFAPVADTDEAGNCVTLVRKRKNSKIKDRFYKLSLPWTGPKAGKRHSGRVFQEVETLNWTDLNIHRTRPAWSHNGGAFVEEGQTIFVSAERAIRKGNLWIGPGDQNIGTRPDDNKMEWGPTGIARKIDGDVITVSPVVVDSCLVGPGIKGKAKMLGKHGSDHHAYMFYLTEK